MRKEELKTPKILLDYHAMRKNIEKYQNLCNENRKQLWPMIKTHKSMEILKEQVMQGATGALCGTLDEAEACLEAGMVNIMYAYPVASTQNIKRVIELAKKSNFIIRIDDLDGAKMLNDMASKEKVLINCTVIVDSGLHRFGVEPNKIVEFVEKLSQFKNLKFRGISTHPGHVYGASSHKDIEKYVNDEYLSLKKAKELLEKVKIEVEIVSSGSTPTFEDAVKKDIINIYHPGNYVFFDAVQVGLGIASEKDCALRVYATVISHPREELFIIDAGAKCLGLDKGAHGNSLITGYGIVVGHPELEVYSLSEEVGKLKVKGDTSLKVGDKIEIIPNHSCSTANLTSYYTLIENDKVIGTIDVDVRGNSRR